MARSTATLCSAVEIVTETCRYESWLHCCVAKIRDQSLKTVWDMTLCTRRHNRQFSRSQQQITKFWMDKIAETIWIQRRCTDGRSTRYKISKYIVITFKAKTATAQPVIMNSPPHPPHLPSPPAPPLLFLSLSLKLPQPYRQKHTVNDSNKDWEYTPSQFENKANLWAEKALQVISLKIQLFCFTHWMKKTIMLISS